MKWKYWLALFVMSFAGELAWGVQTQIFNLFLYNEILPRPVAVSVMVAIGAVVATVTAIGMGALSDQKGRRKPFILAGYIFWGVTVIIFPSTQLITIVWVAVTAVILFNALMSFFRATAYEASYHAYLTDITNLRQSRCGPRHGQSGTVYSYGCHLWRIRAHRRNQLPIIFLDSRGFSHHHGQHWWPDC